MSNRYYDRNDDWDDERGRGIADRARRRAETELGRDFSNRNYDVDDDRASFSRGYGRDTGYSDRFDQEPYSGSRLSGREYGDVGRRSPRDYGYQGPMEGYSTTGSRYRDERSYRSEGNRGQHERGWFDRAADEVSSWFGDEDAERRRHMDESRERGSYAGRGPKGYKRSDERIREDVCDRLSDHPYLDASDIEVNVNEGIVTLSGTARDRRTKRLAEDLVESCSGVQDVDNKIRVNRPATSLSTPMAATPATPATTPDKGIKH
jgi:osmotically-inducible protein OsmY